MKTGSWLFVGCTTVLLGVTFYFPLLGLGLLTHSSSSASARWDGLTLLLPSVVLLLWLVGMLPALHGRPLLWLGIGSNLLLLIPLIACLRLGFPAALGAVAMVAYSSAWWFLIKGQL